MRPSSARPSTSTPHKVESPATRYAAPRADTMTQRTTSSSEPGPTLADYLRVLPQYALPQHLLSRLMYRATRSRVRPWKNLLIRRVIHRYGVDMSIAERSNAEAYPNFNAFFTRALKPDARPVVSGTREIACPVDGAISQLGDIQGDSIFQAKGRHYRLEQLLGGSAKRAAPFLDGAFATIYLSPSDYHRIHMPLKGELKEMVYIPGRLFSVDPSTTRVVPRLFARNERVVTLFETAAGPLALVLVGAIFVASIETVWAGPVSTPFGNSTREWDYASDSSTPVVLDRGQEMGRFNMGSTVIVVFGPGQVRWSPALAPGATTQMGQLLGETTA